MTVDRHVEKKTNSLGVLGCPGNFSKIKYSLHSTALKKISSNTAIIFALLHVGVIGLTLDYNF